MTSRRILRASLFSAALCAVLASRVIVGFEPFRAKLVQRAPVLPVNGIAQVEADRPQVARPLEPPFAVIARIQNDSPTPQSLAVVIDDRSVCNRIVPAGRAPRRIDCVWDGEWSPTARHHIKVVAGNSAWKLSYLEIATHHGATRTYDLIIVAAVHRHARLTPSAVVFAFVMITLVFLLPTPPMSGALIILHRTASAAAGVLFLLVFDRRMRRSTPSSFRGRRSGSW